MNMVQLAFVNSVQSHLSIARDIVKQEEVSSKSGRRVMVSSTCGGRHAFCQENRRIKASRAIDPTGTQKSTNNPFRVQLGAHELATRHLDGAPAGFPLVGANVRVSHEENLQFMDHPAGP